MSLSATCARLRALNQLSIQTDWHYWEGELRIEQATQPGTWQNWPIAHLNAKDHLAWAKGRVVRWFSTIVTVPDLLQNYPLANLCLRLGLLWWAEDAQVYVNGQRVQSGDLFDCAPRLLLSSSVAAGDQFAIALRLVSPNHDDGALMKSVCYYEAASINDPLEPSFVADELEVLHIYLTAFNPEKLDEVSAAVAQIDWDAASDRPRFDCQLADLRDRLQPLATIVKQRKIQLVGHAHLDMAWLWTVDETWQQAQRTFESVLALQRDFPELTFAHSTPALYEWIEQNRPDLFEQIRQQIQLGRWEAIGGLWIEPELNLISGESIARHILYGQRYFQEKFGKISRVAWLPDSFGFNWQLPQLLKLGGIDYFVTQKLRWNDTTQFPHQLFWWEAPDGTRVLSMMSAPIGEGIDPIKMAKFACEWETQTGMQTSLWLPGVGDHGGGPTRDMLEVARRWGRSAFFPQLEFTTVEGYLQQIEQSESSQDLPVWNSELYLEFHRGCYTTHADQKSHNRFAEKLIGEAELGASLATICIKETFHRVEIEAIWKEILFNQFHDILPGSAIAQVFEEANEAWESAEYDSLEIAFEARKKIAQSIVLPTPPHSEAQAIVVFNLCNQMRSEFASVSFRQADGLCDWQVCNLDGDVIDQQNHVCDQEPGRSIVTFLAKDIPAIGYRCFWLCPYKPTIPFSKLVTESLVLENEFLQVSINSETGDIDSIFDKNCQREVLRGPGNQLQAFQDAGQYWDAWNIDPNYAEHPLPPAKLVRLSSSHSIRKVSAYIAKHAFEDRIEVERVIGRSTFTHVYVLEPGNPSLQIHTYVDWQERHVLVKAAFPLNVEADYVTYEIPCGTIQRTTKPKRDREKAQWEVPALRWADLSDGNYGVSILTDSKHGFDAQPNQLRLTLLRGSEFPDPDADKGQHSFTYAIYPHTGDWRAAKTVQRAYELDRPLQIVRLRANEYSIAGGLPTEGSFLELGAENLILMAFKQSEHHPDQWVLRCYECSGEAALLEFSSTLGLRLESAIDLLEQPTDSPKIEGQTAQICPYQIASFIISTERSRPLV